MKNIILFTVLLCSLASCWDFRRPVDNYPRSKIFGYKPVYSQDSTLLRIVVDSPQQVKNPGKIYAMGNLIYQNEKGYGIHVLDRTDPTQIRNKGFIRIRGNMEMSIKGNFLYVNSYRDLVVLNIADWLHPVEVKRIKDAFIQGGEQVYNLFLPPPEHQVYYECVNPYQGIQTGWVKDSIYYGCYYP